MFYLTADNAHGLAHDPFKAIVSPRPIGWIGTRALNGTVNLAPYSFFNAISDTPKMVMFSSSGRKDSVRNIEETGIFTASFVSRDLVQQMNASSAPLPHGTSEFEIAGLTAEVGTLVDAPYVGEAYAALECRMTEILRPRTLAGGESENYMVLGEVVGIHIREDGLKAGRFDMNKVRPVGRLGYRDYADAGDVFELVRPSS